MPDERDTTGVPGTEAVTLRAWLRANWQLPALLLGVLLLSAGIVTAVVTKPKAGEVRVLEEVEHLVAAEKYEAALEVLNTKAIKAYQEGRLGREQMKQFHVLRGRAIYLAEQAKGIAIPENAANVVAAYEKAEELAGRADFEPLDRYYLAQANATLGKYTPAIDLANGLPPELRVQRGRVIKRVVEGLLAAPNLDSDLTLKLLADFLGQRELTVDDRGWALARQTELLLRQGLVSSAVMKVLQTMPGLMSDLGREQMGELYILLGRAYFESDALSEASRQLQLGVSLLLPSDVRHAEAMLLLARIDEQAGDPPEEGRAQAKAKFADIAERFEGGPTALPALLGLGEVESSLGNVEASLGAYRALVQEMGAKKKHRDVTPEVVTRSLMACVERQFDLGAFDRALDYAMLAERLYATETPDSTPPGVLMAIARAQRAAAEQLVGGAGTGDQRARLLELSRLDPATREQVRQRLIAAGRYFKKHADAVGIHDNAGFGRSLWMAADCYDLAGDREQAIPLYAEYARSFRGERQQPEARFRLGQAHQARGDYATAADLYRGLIEEVVQTGRSGSAGPYGDASFVPLAQCYLADGDPSNDAEAESLLERVVSGAVGGPESVQFTEALRELGRLRYAKGDFAGAIGLLNEAAMRMGSGSSAADGGARAEGEAAVRLRFELAEAMRQDAKAIERTLMEAMPESRRQSLVAARRERLARSGELYEDVKKALEARGKEPGRGGGLTELERLYLRNSWFLRADCEFELGNYESAIRQYDAAREKYSSDPASLVAMIQIVNAYVEMGDMKRAATAQERAKRFYESLPVTAWQDPGLPMGQKEWEGWLKSINALKPIKETGAAQAGVSGTGGGGH